HRFRRHVFRITAIYPVSEQRVLPAEIVVPSQTVDAVATRNPGRKQYALARLNAGNFLAHARNLTCDVRAWNMRHRNPDTGHPAPHPQIKMVQRTRSDAN